MTHTSRTSTRNTRQILMSATHSISAQLQSITDNILILIIRFYYNGMFECFFAGFCRRLVASDCSARMMRKRVLRGSITSSI